MQTKDHSVYVTKYTKETPNKYMSWIHFYNALVLWSIWGSAITVLLLAQHEVLSKVSPWILEPHFLAPGPEWQQFNKVFQITEVTCWHRWLSFRNFIVSRSNLVEVNHQSGDQGRKQKRPPYAELWPCQSTVGELQLKYSTAEANAKWENMNIH